MSKKLRSEETSVSSAVPTPNRQGVSDGLHNSLINTAMRVRRAVYGGYQNGTKKPVLDADGNIMEPSTVTQEVPVWLKKRRQDEMEH